MKGFGSESKIEELKVESKSPGEIFQARTLIGKLALLT